MVSPSLNKSVFRKAVGWPTCQACYYIGAGFCQLLESLPDHDWEKEGFLDRVGRMLYVCYNRFMLWSVAINDWAGMQVWRQSKETEL